MSHGLLTSSSVEPAAGPTCRAGRNLGTRLLRGVARGFRCVGSLLDWLFGAVALTVGLAILASIPLVQCLTFGYLLESCGRVARTGQLRAGFIGVRKASRLGSMAFGVWIFLLPLGLVSSLAHAAELVDPGGRAALAWKCGLIALTILVAVHVAAACARGGRIWQFMRPWGNLFWIARRWREGGAYTAARDAFWAFVAGLRLPYYFRLGALGFVGTMAWLVVPASLIAAGHVVPILALPGALLVGVVAMPLPFLQARYATEGRFGAFLEWRSVRQQFCRAPWAFALALIVALTASVPLHLLKIEMIPRETVWLPSLVFLAFTFPAKLLTGWAYGRSLRRELPRHGTFRHTGRLAMLPVAAFYVLIVFLSQYTAWRGVWGVYEQHAFLIPVPFLGL